MCGIFGAINAKNWQDATREMFRISLSRGSEAAGLVLLDNKHINVIKTDQKASQLLDLPACKNLFGTADEAVLIFGHTRMATHGSANNDNNNQPVISRKQQIIGVHNGLVTNYQNLLHYESSQLPELDTQVLLDYLEDKLLKNQSMLDVISTLEKSLQKIRGVANLALLFPQHNLFVLYSNNGSLHLTETNHSIYFASEKSTLQKICAATSQQIKNQLITFAVDCASRQIKMVKNGLKKQSAVSLTNRLTTLQRHHIDQDRIRRIPRCSRCILTNTTPFITFDEAGICNYCREHQPIQQQGDAALESILRQYRRTDGQPDCLVAFSGGRDSSYGLHLLKTKFRMNPVAFTYDWGMISDLGRRNQARLLGQLGVEQILVSANLAQKRAHIRQNILAWCKKPDLGMVPLFMQGDKQCEYYTDQAAKKYQLPLVIYCRGNELEREEFKAGYCGIKNADPGGVIHHLSAADKLRLLGYYGKQYLLNPSYLNSSIFDTAFGYLSTYWQPHNYLYLWHYLPWNEDQIVRTLTKKYDWELSTDTPTSWRIGDGTPAFYNYIYYQVQGFTENDSLRARQVREGIISRTKALELVFEENKPQYHNLKWYFDTLDLDGDRVLAIVDKMEKKYE